MDTCNGFLALLFQKPVRIGKDMSFCALPLEASELVEIVLIGQKVSLSHPSDGSRADTLACDTSQLECDFKEPTCWSGFAPADVAHMPMIYLCCRSQP